MLDLITFIVNFVGFQLWGTVSHLMTISESLVIFLIGFYALRQPEILYPEFLTEKVNNPSKYTNSGLDEKLSKEIMKSLLAHMKEKRPFMNNELKLTDLASQLGVSSHHLSQVINETGNKNFYDFINEYRVNKAKDLLIKFPENGIMDIAFASGFNNRTSFNNAFRKFTGTTPSAFKNNL